MRQERAAEVRVKTLRKTVEVNSPSKFDLTHALFSVCVSYPKFKFPGSAVFVHMKGSLVLSVGMITVKLILLQK